MTTTIEERGYRSFGLDLQPSSEQRSVRGDAHMLPFLPGSFDVVVACDCLHHLMRPDLFVGEATRVLRAGGALVIWVPFLYPFHGNDLWRFTPRQLTSMLEEAGLQAGPVTTRLSIVTLLALIAHELFERIGLGKVGEAVMAAALRWDDRVAKRRKKGQAYAVAYSVVARKPIRLNEGELGEIQS